MFTSPGQFQWPATARWQDAIVWPQAQPGDAGNLTSVLRMVNR
jgi:hypothetical protein